MCGRLACGLRPEDVCNACCYKKTRESSFVRPLWKPLSNGGKTYEPSFNVCPKEVAPVLLSGGHFDFESRVVAPMVFGLIPSWSMGKTTGGFSTINCRAETMKSSKLYGNLVQKGQRCAVVCNGFFEWSNENNVKKPYFVHGEQPSGITAGEPCTWNFEFCPEKGYSGYKPLKLAALFEKTKDEIGVFSFTIITMEAGSKMSLLHHRMPMILETEEQLDAWLNYKQFNIDQALNHFSVTENIDWFPVSNLVNKQVNKDVRCIKQSLCNSDKNSGKSSAALMRNWLLKGQKRAGDETTCYVEEKRKPV